MSPHVSPPLHKTEYRGARGEISVSFRSPFVVLTRVTGHFSADMQDCLLRPTKEAMARGARLALFHDWEAMTGYDSNVRQNLTAWSLEHRTQIASINILVRSKIVAMRCNSRPRAEPWRNAIAFLLGPR
jgi:hypothetical protein